MAGDLLLNVKVDTSQAHAALDNLASHAKVVKDFYTSGLMGKVFGFCKGRTMFFALLFTIVGILLAFMGKLTPTYVAFVGAIQSLVFAHSTKEDWHTQRMTSLQPVVVNNTVTPLGS